MIASACLLEAQPGPAAAWLVLLGWAAVCAGGRRPAREIATREPLAWLVVASLVFRAPSGPPAPSTPAAPAVLCEVARRLVVRPGPPGPAARPCNADRHRGGPPIGCGLVCWYGSLFSNVACNSPPALCWFVSVCSVASLVFVNCMRLVPSAGPAARRPPAPRPGLATLIGTVARLSGPSLRSVSTKPAAYLDR